MTPHGSARLRLLRCRAFALAVGFFALTYAPSHAASPDPAPAQVEREIAAGRSAFERRDYTTAIALWRDPIARLLQSGNAANTKRAGDLLFLYGVANGKIGQPVRAIASLQAAEMVHHTFKDRSGEAGDLSSAGEIQERLEQNGAALESYRKALALDRALKNDADVADDLGHVGNLERLLGRFADAQTHLREALALDAAANDGAAAAEHAGELGNVLNAQGRSDEALALQQRALALHRALKDRAGEATDLGNVANAEENLARYDDALAHDRTSLEIDRSIRSRSGEASALGNIGDVEFNMGRYDDALASHRQALALHRALGDQLEAAGDLLNIGDVDEQLGRYDDALAAFREAETIDRAEKNPLGDAHALIGIGTTEQLLGANADALAVLDRALAIEHTIGDQRGEASALSDIGILQQNAGRYADALASYQQSLAIDRRIGNRDAEAADLLNAGNAQQGLGRATDGVASYRQALAIHQALANALGEASDRANIAAVEAAMLGQYAAARDDARQAAALDAKLAVPEERWRALSVAAYADAHLGNRDDAVREYDGALERIEALRAGLGSGERGVFFADKRAIYDDYIAYLLQLDATFPGNGYDRKALEVFERKSARATLEQIGQSAARHFRDVDPGVVAAEDAAQAHIDRAEEMRAKLLATSGTNDAVLAAAERDVDDAHASAAAVESSVAKRYPAFYALRHPQPLLAACGQTPCPTIAAFQQSILQPGEVALVYDVIDAHSALWIVERSRITLVPLAAGTEIDAAVARLNVHVAGMIDAVGVSGAARLERQAAADIPAFAADSYALYRMLVPPAAADALARAKRLIVVPSGSLYRLAFETLVTHDPAKVAQPHYLLADLPVSYVPSLSLLEVVRDSYSQPAPGRSPLLAFANPAYGVTADAQTRGPGAYAKLQLDAVRSQFGSGTRAAGTALAFSPLPGTQVEAEAVRSALDAPADSLIVAEAASRAHVLALANAGRLKDYRYVLFATHAVLPSEAINTLTQPAIVLAHPERGDGMLTMADVFGLALNADFVTLSACSTGVATAESNGEGISGLTRAFLYAGTPAISVTLWDVDDAAAPRITPPFFAAMAGGNETAADALRRAKLAMLASPDARFRHPYAWAPSVVFGDGDRASARPGT